MQISLFSVLALAFALGMRHATDADHVVAVSTIVSREQRVSRAAWIGILWGVGHTLTICLVGGAIIFLKIGIPPRVGLAMEFAVGIMLVALGYLNLRNDHASIERMVLSRTRPLFVGFVHGLAGSAAVALLVLTAIPDARWALAYLLLFGAGTVAGMLVVSAMIAVPALALSRRFHRFEHALRYSTAAASIAFGLFLLVHIGFVDGLFSTQPQWSPK